ncbi:MAG: GTPase Era [Gaiellales bacterium]|nr:MAG: GTPase Era [Gaiellales bacterium]
MIDPGESRSGFVAVLGRPNVGKSTLVNTLVGEKVAIVSDRPQTTRNRIAGVMNLPGCQAVLLDLPGFQRPLDRMTEKMQAAVNETLGEVDMTLVVLNAVEPVGPGDRFVAAAAFAAGNPVFVVVNKTDIATDAQLLAQLEEAAGLGPAEEFFPVSAATGDGVGELRQAIASRLPEGPAYFPPDVVSDQPERVLVGELIREQAIRLMREEVPHALAVRVLEMEPREGGGVIDVEAVLVTETKSQKGIVIGHRGKIIREIGTRARREIEALLGSRVFLDLRVQVRKKWRQDDRMLDELGI